MRLARKKRKEASGGSLIIFAIILALTPPVLEMFSDGGPSQFGQPDTGLVMIFTGFFLWPAAIICFLIGVLRLGVSPREAEQEDKSPEAAPPSVVIDNAWASLQVSDKADQPKERTKQ